LALREWLIWRAGRHRSRLPRRADQFELEPPRLDDDTEPRFSRLDQLSHDIDVACEAVERHSSFGDQTPKPGYSGELDLFADRRFL
jgi:hypothetical protein